MSFLSKFTRPDYTLTSADFKMILFIIKLNALIGYFLLSSSCIFFILGFSFLIAGFDSYFVYFIIGGLCLLLGLLSLLPTRKYYLPSRTISKAMKSNNSKLLFSLLEIEDLSKSNDQFAFVLAFYALVDIAPNDLFDYLSLNLEMLRNNPYINYNALNKMLNSLALKLDYKDSEEMLLEFKSEIKHSSEQSFDEFADVDLRIPVTKVYFVDELSPNQRSMISGLPIDLKNDFIVACPNCGNMAEKRLLENWLVNNNICPICKRVLSIDDLPVVKMKN
ncbi:MAG TPA: hypothetical protein VMZ29_07605 [Candidatus Bathyarchaeia archaeon]|nr:hypothetical protein [Candidatus Bathyarchaeia archaeon]